MMQLEKIIEKAKAFGFDEVELYIETTNNKTLKLFGGEISNHNISSTFGVTIRAKVNGKMAYAYTECLDDDSIEKTLKQLLVNAKLITSSEEETIVKSGQVYPKVEVKTSDYSDVLFDEKVEKLKKINDDALKVDKRIVKIGTCTYSEVTTKIQIINSNGLNLIRNNSYVVAILGVVACSDSDHKVGYAREVKPNFKDIDWSYLVNTATSDALSSLGAGSLPTGSYEVILDSEVATAILSAFMPVFAGESAIKKLTSLTDKIDQQIMGTNISLIDDPFYDKAINKYPFDDEGMPCYCKKVVDKGVFKGFFHNTKTAKVFNTHSTGNGFKTSIASTISTTPTNFYLVPGNKTKDELISSLSHGVLITDVSGLHAGVNTISGAFNLLASGFIIKNGQKERPVNLLVISGNFYEMMNNVEDIGNDLKQIISVASPSLKIKELLISCK